MALSADLAAELVSAAVGDREVRAYPALLSTESAALAWARGGAPDGAVVVADHQVAARSHGGRVRQVKAGRDLGFSMILRPSLAIAREGWLYTVATAAIAEVCGDAATISWPDVVHVDGRLAGAVGVHGEPGPTSLAWAVASVVVFDVAPPRPAVLRRAAEAIEAKRSRPTTELLAEHRARCATLGRRVCAQLVPMGSNGRRVTGRAASTLKDGALVVEADDGRRVAVTPQALGRLDEL